MMQLGLLVILIVIWTFIACCICAVTAAILGVMLLYQGKLREGLPLMLSAVFLSIGLCIIPHLNYYVGYGIRSKALRSEHIIFCAIVLALLASLATPGRKKWILLIPSLILMIPYVFA